MALEPTTYQFITNLGVTRLIDASTGPDGPQGVTAYFLVPANGWYNGHRFPHDVEEDLGNAKLEKATFEGLDYYLIPEESSNLPGRLSHYAQLTGVAELQNPPGGGVNRVRETLENTAKATVAPDQVEEFVKDNDSWEEARTKKSEQDERVDRQISVSPAREPSEGKLIAGEPAKGSDRDKGARGGTKSSSERPVKPTGETKPGE